MKKISLLFGSIIILVWIISACGDKNKIAISEPNASTVWTSSQGVHPIKWKNSKASEHIYICKGKEKLFEVSYYVGDDGEVVIKHPNVERGADYSIKIEDEKSNYGFSELFKIE
jgi:hypothetical protein